MSLETSSAFQSGGEQRLDAVESARAGNEAWVGANQSVTVAGYTISDAMVYVACDLSPVCELERVEPAAIDPSLSVDGGDPDRAGDSLDYWPSYSAIEPSARAAYLDYRLRLSLLLRSRAPAAVRSTPPR